MECLDKYWWREVGIEIYRNIEWEANHREHRVMGGLCAQQMYSVLYCTILI